MSDTVKLIIEIPKKEYEAFKELIAINMGGRCSGKGIIQTCLNAVKNGIPLDDVKAEIEKHQFSREYCCDHNIDTAIDMGMVRIILDNIGKESEEEWLPQYEGKWVVESEDKVK